MFMLNRYELVDGHLRGFPSVEKGDASQLF